MNLPLQGLHLLNTRPLDQAGKLTQAIEALGGRVTACPALEIRALPFSYPPHGVFTHFDHAIFISQHAVAFFFNQNSNPSWGTTFAIGQATALALSHYQIQAICPSSEENSEALLALPQLQHVEGQHILLIKGKGGRPTLAEILRQRGATVTELNVYERILPKYSEAFLYNIWHDAGINIILFTSEQSMQQLFTLLGSDAVPWLRKTPCLVISSRLADAAAALGIKTCFIAKPEHIIDRLIEIGRH